MFYILKDNKVIAAYATEKNANAHKSREAGVEVKELNSSEANIGKTLSGDSFVDTPKTAEEIRSERNAKLSETDWWASSDLTMTQEQIDYRQALRDITAQVGFPHDVAWPVKP